MYCPHQRVLSWNGALNLMSHPHSSSNKSGSSKKTSGFKKFSHHNGLHFGAVRLKAPSTRLPPGSTGFALNKMS
ncbi:hypothetical protein BSKO_05776 [Bryopsis sp. KO-2023]|nr:hypothetical protein BSKO_05776 [Bryopsis sp. KO-2023]